MVSVAPGGLLFKHSLSTDKGLFGRLGGGRGARAFTAVFIIMKSHDDDDDIYFLSPCFQLTQDSF